MSVSLDIVRAGAALVVLVCHAVQVGIYTGPFPDIPMAQHYAVVVFFVLSGLVISTSVQKNRGTLSSYAISRTARILPVSLAALAFGTAAFLLAMSLGASPLHTDTYGELTLRGTVLPALFLSESTFGAGPVWNPPYWSLCYEAWYYALFAAAVFLRGGRRVVSIALLAVLAGPRILLLLPVWLVGVWLAVSKRPRRATFWQGLGLLAVSLACAALLTGLVWPAAAIMRELAGAYYGELGFSRFVLTDFVLALAVATSFIGLRPLADKYPQLLLRLERPARVMAGFSFTLYLFHWPILCLMRTFHLTSGNSIAGFMLLLAMMIAACFAISLFTERKRNAVRAVIEGGARKLRNGGRDREQCRGS